MLKSAYNNSLKKNQTKLFCNGNYRYNMEEKIMNQNRRDFLKNALKVSVGLATVTAMPAGLAAFAEEKKQEDFNWVPNSPACKLIEETTNDSTPKGTRSFKYITDGRVCSKSVTFDIVGDDRLLSNVVYDGGCDGGTQGIGVMAEGRKAEDVVRLYKDVVCANKKSGSSCPMQLSYGVNQALMIMDGIGCAGCDGTICSNMK